MPAVRELDIIKRGVKHLLPFLAKKLLPDITQQDIQDVVDHELARGASNRYVNVMIGTLRSILRRNHQWERLRADYKKLKEPMTAGKELSYEEEEKLLKECRLSASRVLFLAVILGLYSGLRREEMRLLRWYQIDLQKAFLTVGESKTPHGEHRVVPLIGPALEAMKIGLPFFQKDALITSFSPLRNTRSTPTQIKSESINIFQRNRWVLGSGHGKQRADVPVSAFDFTISVIRPLRGCLMLGAP